MKKKIFVTHFVRDKLIGWEEKGGEWNGNKQYQQVFWGKSETSIFKA